MGVALALGGAGLVTARRGGLGYALLLVAAGLAPLAAVRNRDLLAMMVVPAVASLPLVRGWRGRRARPRPRACSPAIALLVIPAAGLLGYPRPAWTPGLVETGFPRGAVRFLEREAVGHAIFNVYDQGGYLIYCLAPGAASSWTGATSSTVRRSTATTWRSATARRTRARAARSHAGADLLLLRYPAADGYMGLGPRRLGVAGVAARLLG